MIITERKYNVRFMNKNFNIQSNTYLGWEKIIKQQGNKSLVKCLGYHDSFNSLVNNKDVSKLYSQSPMSQLHDLAFTSFPDVRPLWCSSLVPASG